MTTVVTPQQLIDFLRGEGEIDGKWFGDTDDKGAAFWWRKHLPILSTASPQTDQVERAEISKRLCGLHSRLSLCWEGAAGEQPPRRPHVFEPQWQDLDTLLDAAVALQAIEIDEGLKETLQEIADGWKFDDPVNRLVLIREKARKALEALSSGEGVGG